MKCFFIALLSSILIVSVAVAGEQDPERAELFKFQTWSFANSDMQTCGDVNGDGILDIADVVFLIDWLFSLGGVADPVFADADFDRYELVTMNEVFYLLVFAMGFGPPPTCPPVFAPLHEVGVPDQRIYIHSYESHFPYAAILPPGQSTYSLHIHFTTNRRIQRANLPIAIRIGTEIPEIVDVSWPQPCDNAAACLYQGKFDPATATVNVGFYTIGVSDFIEPGTREVMQVELTVPSEVDVWRPVFISLDSLGPVQNGRYVHHPWVITDAEDIKLPTVFRFPCIGIRGNVDGNDTDDINISDVTYLVDFMFGNPPGPPPQSFEEADVDASIGLDISDVTYIVKYMFQGGPAPLPCPDEI